MLLTSSSKNKIPFLASFNYLLQKILQRYSPWLMGCALFFFGLWSFYQGEKITVNFGLGFDGILFGRIANDFYQMIAAVGLDNYFIQRILPSGIIHLGLRVLHLSPDIMTIVKGFELYNFFLILVSVLLWNRISSLLGLTLKMRWLGFIGLFVNFAVLKFYFYYPVLTDVTAFTIALAMIYFFLARQALGLLLLTLVGSFAWPTLIYVGLLLFVFPAQEIPSKPLKPVYPMILASLFTGILGGFVFYVNFILGHSFSQGIMLTSLRPLSFFLLLVYAFFAIKELSNNENFYALPYLKKSSSLLRLILALLLYAGIQIIIQRVSATHTDLFVVSLKNLIHLGIKMPLACLLGHVMYYGPILFLVIFFWKDFCKTIHAYGLGVSSIIFLGIIFSLSSEGRHSTAFMPFFIVFLAKALNDRSWDWWKMAGLGLISLFCSKVWFLINAGLSWDQGFSDAAFLLFPLQRYFMHFAPFMNFEMYLVHGLAALLSCLLLFLLFVKNPWQKKNPDF